MSKTAIAALKLAIKTLTEQYGWIDVQPAAPDTRRTTARMKHPSGARIKLAVVGDHLVGSVNHTLLHKCYIGDPQYDHSMSKIETVIANNTAHALVYAQYALRGPFPAGEAAIAKDAQYAYEYARRVLKGPFPAGEAAIAKDAEYAYEYAYSVLKDPFPAGEKAIAKDDLYAYHYACDVLEGPFPAGEKAIAENTNRACDYACDVLEGPFPAGEAAIAQDVQHAYRYALNVLKLPESKARNWRESHLARKGIKV